MPVDVDALTIAELAAEAQVDRRSVLKALRGDIVRGLAGARIARALEARVRVSTSRKLASLVSPETPTS